MDWPFLLRLVDQLPVAIFGKDARPGREGRFQVWNRTAESLFGIAAGDILGKTDYDLFPKEQADHFTTMDAQVMRSGVPVRIDQEPVDSPTLGRRWVRTQKVPLYTEAGEPEMLVGISEDITQLLAHEEALQTGAQSLAEAQRIGHMGNWAWDIHTNALTWSEEIFRIFDLDPEAFPPSYPAFLERVHPQDRPQVEQAVAAALRGEAPYSLDHRVVRPSGEILVVHEQGEVQRDADGKPHRMMGTVQDITERTAAERLQREFVSTVSHELRTPLTAIRGALGLVLGHPSHPLAADTRSLLEVALRNSERLGAIINDILDLSKIEAGALDLIPQVVDLAEEVTRALLAHAALGSPRNVAFGPHCPPVGSVRVDPQRFQQVLGNLLANAVKFSPDGTSVEVSTWRREEWTGVTVTNRGPEIPLEFRPRLFQKFAQADASDSRPKAGTGLGLNISKALVERMGGRIGFESQPHTTQFWIAFPTLPDGA